MKELTPRQLREREQANDNLFALSFVTGIAVGGVAIITGMPDAEFNPTSAMVSYYATRISIFLIIATTIYAWHKSY
jgi:hypothetical protein